MELEIGKLYRNRTLKYLVPALNFYGPTLKTKFGLIQWLAVGVHDKLIDGSYLEGQQNLFILVDKFVRPDSYQNFIDWIAYQPFFVTTYQVQEERFTMLVIAFPYQLADAFDKFKQGKYSKMYSEEEIRNFFGEKPEARKVLKRYNEAKYEFTVLVKKTYGTDLVEEDFKKEVFEYDLPPVPKEEIFNY